MHLIPLIFLCLSLGGAQVVCPRAKLDPVTMVNNLLQSNSESTSDYEDKIELARKILSEMRIADVKQEEEIPIHILEAFVALDPVALKVNRIDLDCSTNNVENVIRMRKIFKSHYDGAGPPSYRKLLPLVRSFYSMEHKFLSACLYRIDNQIYEAQTKDVAIQQAIKKMNFFGAWHYVSDNAATDPLEKLATTLVGKPSYQSELVHLASEKFPDSEHGDIEILNNLWKETCDKIDEDATLKCLFSMGIKFFDALASVGLYGGQSSHFNHLFNYLLCKALKNEMAPQLQDS